MKDSFVLYCSLREPLKKMSENEAGSLFMAILDYVAEGIEPENLTPAADMAFAFVKSQLDRDGKKYEEICKKRAVAGMKGGLKKQANLANANTCYQNVTNLADTENDTENGSENDTENDNKYSVDFQTFWSVYPRKADKGQCYKKYKARINDGYSPAELLSAATNYAEQCRSQRTEQQFIKHGKTFLGDSLPFADFIPKMNETDLQKTETAEPGGNPFRKK